MAELRAILASGRSLAGLRLESLDLDEVEDQLIGRPDVRGLIVLGGHVSSRLGDQLRDRGAILFPAPGDAPVPIFRSGLYTPQELYASLEKGYDQTPDARAYRWSRQERHTDDVYSTLRRAIHDDQIGDALTDVLAGRVVSGVMGGHAVTRGSPAFADAARLGHRLAQAGHIVLTGGGPGAMEGANLGAFAADIASLEEALSSLSEVPGYAGAIERWASAALTVRAQLVAEREPGGPPRSIGIPTWFYGHEPPNVFVDHVAKYFSNALREDRIISRCTGGIVVLPGAAGTVQEVFQAITALYYSDPDQALPPLVLVDRRHWTRQIPVWDVVTALAAGRPMAHAVHLVEHVDEAAEVLIRSGSRSGRGELAASSVDL